MANRLAGESSPYLVAHSGNPVDWFPWGREALEKAEKEDKPIFLSIGYSACHWCHVMERESFQNRETAEILNSNFICIKVDREERPDLDSVYMAAVQVITGRGGWPLNAFLLPDGTPFYGGTYFPPLNKVEQYGIQSFPEILLRIADAYRTRRHEIESSAEGVIAALRHQARVTPGANPPGEDFHGASIDVLAGMFDHRNGGFQGAPKFPMATILEYLLRFQGRGAAEMALVTLRRMACGGIRDHLGGGFHRYSTDRLWLIPHFEKMLYDNALLGRVYTEAFQITGEELFRRTAETTLDFILREMRVTEGGFCSSMDADSPASSGEMEEGAYYTWTREEIREVIGPQTEEFCSTYGVAPMGALRGRSVLHLEGQGLQADMQEPRAKLLARRAKRGKPFRDNKVITAWNGMAIRALASASHILGRSDYLKAAVSAADFIIENMVDPGGILFRSWKDGRVSTPGFLQDYALLASGFLEIHRATGDHRFFDWANRIVRTMIESFRNPNTGHMGSTGNNNELLFAELFDPMDSAVPSGMSAAAEVLLKLWAVTGEEPMYEEARKILSDHSWKAVKFPVGFGRMLCASLFQLADTGKAMIEGSKRHEFIGVLNRVFSPFTLLAPGDTGSKGKTRVVICGKGYCLPPVFDQASFEELLKKRGPAKAGPQ